MIANYMTKVPHSIEPHYSLQEAKDRMYSMSVTHLPVLSGGKIIGVLSERDILYLKSIESVDLTEVQVGNAMTPDPITASEEDSLQSVCKTMVENRVGSILVKNAAGALAGIFTYTDALKTLAKF